MKKTEKLTDIIFNQVSLYGNEYDVFFFGSARSRNPDRQRKIKERPVIKLKPKKI